MKTMNKILVILGVTTLVFVAVCFFYIWHNRTLPDSLVYSYFSSIGAEGFIMGWIKTSKTKGEHKNENNN